MKIILTKKIIASMVLIFSGVFVQLSAQNAKEILGEDLYNRLSEKGKLEFIKYKYNTDFEYLPDTELNSELVSHWTDEKSPVFVGENIYLLPKTKLCKQNAANGTIDYASKVIRSVSKMQGLKYYSNREKKWQTLYKKAYTIKSGTDVTRIPDQTEGSADGKVIYGLQDDHSFGKTNYCIKYRETENEVAATFTNVTPLHVGPIKAVESEDLVIDIVITDCGDDFIVYLTVRAKFLAVSVLEPIMNDSLSSRLNAIYSWFVNQF